MRPEETAPSNVALCGIGALAALGFSVVRAQLIESEPRVAPAVVWVADRDGDRVFGLDETLAIQHRVRIADPLEIEATSDGGAYVIHSRSGTPVGEHGLVRLDATGSVVATATLSAPRDLDLWNGTDALVVDAGRVILFTPDGTARSLLDESRARCVAADSRRAVAAGTRRVVAAGTRRVLIGTDDGRLILVDLSGDAATIANETAFSEPIADVARASGRGRAQPAGWWALSDSVAGTLRRFDEDLRVLWQVNTGISAAHLASDGRTERVWLASRSQRLVRCYGASGALLVERADLPLAGLDRAAVWREGVLLCAPGALLRLDASGALQPGQGGFEYLTDVACVSAVD